MKIRAITIVLLLFLLSAIIFVTPVKAEKLTPLVNDVFIASGVPRGIYRSAPAYEPGYYETSEYMIGSVAVGVIFLESNGTVDPSTEDWTSTEESRVISEITTALNWWANQNPNAGVSFVYDIHYRVPTSYEPISRPANPGQLLNPGEKLWISEAMAYLGYSGVNYFIQVLDYLNDLRDTLGTDWAYAMFIVDSSNDPDGKFADGYFAYAYLGGPFLVMTYDNDNYGIGNMDYVAAHETGHIFYATDEYDGVPEISGYLGVQDNDGSGDLMDRPLSWWLCTNTKGQIGWRDTDGDGIQDIVDTFPETTLNPYVPDPTNDTVLTYTGSVVEVPYPNSNPYGTGRDITINTITKVEFRADFGSWVDADPADGSFDEDEEEFVFNTPPLSMGTHLIEVRGINSVGNVETTYGSDTVTTLTPIKIHVESIEMTKRTLGRGRSFLASASATVTIVDAYGNPVRGARVYGLWSGLASGRVYGVTDAYGRVTFKSKFVRRASGTFTFTVEDVSKNGWVYDPDANLETSDSITV